MSSLCRIAGLRTVAGAGKGLPTRHLWQMSRRPFGASEQPSKSGSGEARERKARSRAAGGDPQRGAEGRDQRTSARDEDERAEKAGLEKDVAQPGEEEQL
jgi:hypothetical protein